MFSLIFFAFAQVGYLLLGKQVKDYANLTDSVFSLLRVILGDFDWDGMVAAEPLLGPMYFVCYVLVVFFILLVSQ